MGRSRLPYFVGLDVSKAIGKMIGLTIRSNLRVDPPARSGTQVRRGFYDYS